MAGIRIQNLTKAYGALPVLKDLSIDIPDGEFVALVGPSGCGKSTTLKILAGLEQATGGHIAIGDRDVTDLSPRERDVAMVFQNYALYPHLTVRRNLGFGLKMRKIPAAEINRRVEAAAQTLAIGHLLDRRPRQLSGGQRQRVALGRAIVREPQAFLMDEPLSNLDAKLRVRMRAEIIALHQRLGVTTIYVTHDQTEAMTMADRIVIMHDGEIQQIATPAEMFAHPANIFVAGFIGMPSMNFLQSRVTREGGEARIGLFGVPIALSADLPDVPSGQPVVIGIRPEHITAGDGPVSFDGAVRLVESLGNEQYVHVDVPRENQASVIAQEGTDDLRSELLVARLMNAGLIEPDQTERLSFDPANLHLFDPMTGQALV